MTLDEMRDAHTRKEEEASRRYFIISGKTQNATFNDAISTKNNLFLNREETNDIIRANNGFGPEEGVVITNIMEVNRQDWETWK